MFLVLKNALTPSNIKNGFKACGIWLLNFDAMNGKMGPTQVFNQKVSIDVQMEEILEHGALLIRTKEGATHYFVDVEASSSHGQPYFVDLDAHEGPQEIVAVVEELTNFN